MSYRSSLRPVHAELARAGLIEGAEARLWVRRDRSAWQEVARTDARRATILSAYVALLARRRPLAIHVARPGAYERERTRLIADSAGDPELREHVLDLLSSLWDHVPYGADPAARLEALAWVRPRNAFARRHWEEVVALVMMLDQAPPRAVAASVLPATMRLASDEALVATSDVARRSSWCTDAELEKLAPRILGERRLLQLAEHWGMVRFFRRLSRSSSLAVQMLLLSNYVSLRTPPEWEGVRSTWDVVDELVHQMGADDHDPYSARRQGRSATVTDQVLEMLELSRLLEYEAASGSSGAAVWERVYRGCAGLREMLRVLDPDKDHITVERLPLFPPRPTSASDQGVERDMEQLDFETQAELFVFGVRVLAQRSELLRVWVVAWATICRPREALPFREDLVALPGGGYAIHHERAASKSGASETCASAPAVAVTGLRPSWFAMRPQRQPSPSVYEAHAELLREACRLVRASWAEAGGTELPHQLDYFVRHAGADRLRWSLAGRHHVLSRILRHLSSVPDFAYTKVSESEFASDLAELANDLAELLP